ncbi:hypothetical protein, partial [Nonomuraea composti]|uniref:hypothetical protein n=1 Tax=Nonomuraea composti TaxID=2720023 RepID=UPI00197D981E
MFLDGLGGVREEQPGTGGADLHPANFAAVVPAFVGAVVEDGFAPGQGLEPAQERGLVALDDEQLVATGGGDLPGVSVLVVQGVGGDHYAGQVEPGQQGCERRDLVAYGSTCRWATTMWMSWRVAASKWIVPWLLRLPRRVLP